MIFGSRVGCAIDGPLSDTSLTTGTGRLLPMALPLADVAACVRFRDQRQAVVDPGGHRALRIPDVQRTELAALNERSTPMLRMAWHSLNHLVRAHNHRLRDRQAQRLRCLEIDDQLELRRLLDRKVPRPGALQNLVDITSGAVKCIGDVWAVAHKAAPDEICSVGENCRQLVLDADVAKLVAVANGGRIGDYDHGARTRSRSLGKRRVDAFRELDCQGNGCHAPTTGTREA